MCPVGYTHQPDACTHNRIYPHTSGHWKGYRERHIHDPPRNIPGQRTLSIPHLFFAPARHTADWTTAPGKRISYHQNYLHAESG